MSELIINQYLKALWRRWWVIVLVTVIAVGASLFVSRVMTPVYRASTTVMTGEDNTNPNVTLDNYVLSQRLATGYAGLATRQAILDGVVKTLGLRMDWQSLQRNVLAVPVQNSSLLEIRVSDTNPQQAAAIANEIAHQMILHSSTLTDEKDRQQRQAFTQSQLDSLQTNIDAAQASINEKQAALDNETSARAVAGLTDQIKGLQTKISDWRSQYEKLAGALPAKSASTITVVETATAPTKPVSPNILFNLLLAALAGLVLSCGGILLLEYLQAGKIRHIADIGQIRGATGLATITRIRRREARESKGLITLHSPHSPGAEQFRVLRSNVRFATSDSEPMALLVTSAGMGEGKSTVSANLAVSFAQGGKHTVLVDADLRHPTLHDLFGVKLDEGLSTLLSDPAFELGNALPDRDTTADLRNCLAELVVETSVPNLSLLPAGRAVPTNPGELLAGSSMASLLELLCRSADVVILDSPPLLPVADAAILASLPVAVMLVTEAERTSTKQLELAREALERAEANVIGCILNKASSSLETRYVYRSEYYSTSKPTRPSLRILGRRA